MIGIPLQYYHHPINAILYSRSPDGRDVEVALKRGPTEIIEAITAACRDQRNRPPALRPEGDCHAAHDPQEPAVAERRVPDHHPIEHAVAPACHGPYELNPAPRRRGTTRTA